MTQTHSPTPWVSGSREYSIILSASGITVCTPFENADADFIVTAVNAYEANQAMIKQLVEALDNFVVYDDTPDEQKALEALSAAKEAGF